MRFSFVDNRFPLLLLSVLAICGLGCGQQANNGSSQSDPTQVSDASHDDHDHGGWWCVEHGIPEEQCTLCSSKAADECKSKGDWCEEHTRAESQCFICDPSRADKFAALHEAKFGHKPPSPTE